MGKSIKGRECGKGICQRKDGKYSARFIARDGKRKEKYFRTLPEARRWLAEARYEDAHNIAPEPDRMTVDAWFEFWAENLIRDLAPNTLRNYRDRYKHNIQPLLGHMNLADVRPMHCKAVLNRMDRTYAGSTIRQAYITMGILFRAAVDNELIVKHPMNGVRFSKPVRAVNDFKFLTVEEQERFLAVAERSHNRRQYILLLETGLRTSELVGLTWESIDWERHTLTISKVLEYRHDTKLWRAGPPKSEKSYRTIPLTDRAYEVLRECYEEREVRKESELMTQVLEYRDRRTGETKLLRMHELVFVNYRTGEPSKNSSYDTHIYKLCDEAGIRRFSMHALRHTYATRAIERGMQPKILQKLLGHASIQITMDRYVGVSNESLFQAVRQFESGGLSQGNLVQDWCTKKSTPCKQLSNMVQ